MALSLQLMVGKSVISLGTYHWKVEEPWVNRWQAVEGQRESGYIVWDKIRFPGGSVINAKQETQIWSLGHEDPLERKWQPTPVFLHVISHGQRSLEGSVHGVAKSQKQQSNNKRGALCAFLESLHCCSLEYRKKYLANSWEISRKVKESSRLENKTFPHTIPNLSSRDSENKKWLQGKKQIQGASGASRCSE